MEIATALVGLRSHRTFGRSAKDQAELVAVHKMRSLAGEAAGASAYLENILNSADITNTMEDLGYRSVHQDKAWVFGPFPQDSHRETYNPHPAGFPSVVPTRKRPDLTNKLQQGDLRPIRKKDFCD